MLILCLILKTRDPELLPPNNQQAVSGFVAEVFTYLSTHRSPRSLTQREMAVTREDILSAYPAPAPEADMALLHAVAAGVMRLVWGSTPEPAPNFSVETRSTRRSIYSHQKHRGKTLVGKQVLPVEPGARTKCLVDAIRDELTRLETLLMPIPIRLNG